MRRKLISIAILAGLVLAQHSAWARTGPAREITTQLPRNAVPTHYALSITPDPERAGFSASVAIALELKQPASSVTLNAAGLKFSAASIAAASGQPLAASRIVLNESAQTATFHFGRTLAPGSYQLQLDYTGVIGIQAAGLFSVDYQDGAAKRALYTQFENSDARRMIPSWDEPSYKATFALEAIIPAGQSAVSNMPLASREDLPDGRQRVRFATSPRMSTYLLFFGMGEFERATAMEGGTELGVVTRKGALEQARYALDASRAVLREYNDYFGLPYPLPKLDNIAAPGQSAFFSAMENWGAIFTFEPGLLLDPRSATQADRESVFVTASHEIAHQWFGNLVTMAWWDDLWLNEGFASWMEARTTHRLNPDWEWNLREVATREHAMAEDALSTTHPVVQRIKTVQQANLAFDTITYEKGQAVVRMLEDYVGEDAWRAGVRAYLQAHSYGNTVSDDLWRQVEKAAHKPVTAIAHDFTLQPGVPLIRVADALCKDGSSMVRLTQAEFSKDRPAKKPLSWRVPVIAHSVGGATVRGLVDQSGATLTLPGCGAMMLNAGQSGYYRVLYTAAGFGALARSLPDLDSIDQLGLLADSYALAMAGLQPASTYLELVDRIPEGAAPGVWYSAADGLVALHQQFLGQPAQLALLDQYARSRLAPQLARLGWEARPDEAPTVANLRASLISALSITGDQAVIAEARRRYGQLASQPAGIRRAIIESVAHHADAAAWDQLRALAKAETSNMERGELYALLGLAQDPALARRALALALTDEPGAMNGPAIINRVAYRHPDLAFDFALAHHSQVEQGIDIPGRARYFVELGSGSADPAMVGKLQRYAQRRLAPGERGPADAAVAAVRDRIATRRQRLPEMAAWLARKA